MAKEDRAQHKFCRRIGYCLWGNPKCPSVKRPYPAGQHGKTGRKKKLSTYGELMMEKQKFQFFFSISERQLHIAFLKAKALKGMTNETLFKAIIMRLDSLVYLSGLAPSIFAAKQYVTHRHIYVDGKKVDRPSCVLKEGQVISLNPEKDPALAELVKNSNRTVPSYIMTDKETLKATIIRTPGLDESPLQVDMMKVVEFYSR